MESPSSVIIHGFDHCPNIQPKTNNNHMNGKMVGTKYKWHGPVRELLAHCWVYSNSNGAPSATKTNAYPNGTIYSFIPYPLPEKPLHLSIINTPMVVGTESGPNTIHIHCSRPKIINLSIRHTTMRVNYMWMGYSKWKWQLGIRGNEFGLSVFCIKLNRI